MSGKTLKTEWRKPVLVRIGRLSDVSGNKKINFNGASGNNADPS